MVKLAQKLANDFSPFLKSIQKPGGGGKARLISPIDNEVVGRCNPVTLALLKGGFNTSLPEQLLDEAMRRLTACHEIREKAHAIQITSIERAARAESVQLPAGPAHEAKYYENLERFAELNGHALRYDQRFEFLSDLFDKCFSQAYARAQKAAEGLKAHYVMNPPLPELPAPTEFGYLDELTLWAQDASDALDKELDSRLFFHVPLALKGGEGIENFSGDFTNLGTFKFNPKKDVFIKLSGEQPLIRQIYVEILGGTVNNLWPCVVQLGDPAGTRKSAAKMIAASGGSEFAERYAIAMELHNANPLQPWQLDIPKSNLLTDAVTVSGIVVHLKVSAKRTA